MRHLALAAVAVGLLCGCPFSFTNEEHCAAQAGDATCAAADPSTPFCALDGCGLYDETSNRDGCVAQRPQDQSCHSPCGGKLDANARSDCAEETSTTSVDPGTDTEEPSSSTTTTGELESGSTPGCSCDASAPICLDGTCVACPDDGFCAENFGPQREICEENDCVVCAPNIAEPADKIHRGCTDSERPNCVDGACVSFCLLPEDCPQTGCEHWRGICAPNDRTFHINATGGSDEADGTADAPLATIEEAIDRMGGEAQNEYSLTTIFLSTGTYTEALEFAGRTIVLRPTEPDGAPPILTSPDTRPVFTLLNESDESPQQAVLNVVGVRFEGSEGPVARVGRTARFMADGIEMIDNAAGIESEGQVFLRNSVVAGTAGPIFVAIDASDFGVVASTIVENQAATWFDCSGAGAETIVTIRESIVGNFAGTAFTDLISPECDAAAPVRSVTGADVVASAFRVDDDYRLDLIPGPNFALSDSALCPEGSGLQPTAEPCPPVSDIDGRSRMGDGGNWIGASVP